MRSFLPAVAGVVLVSAFITGSSASWGSGRAVAMSSTIDIAKAAIPDAEADQVATDFMDIWFTQGTASVGTLGAVTVSGGFSCQDPDSPGSPVRLEITLVQNNDAHGYAEGLGVCQDSRTWTATVRPDLETPAFVPDQTIEAHVTMAKDGDVAEHVSAEALLIRNVLFLRTNLTPTTNPDGTITVTGTYGCGASYAPAIHLTTTATDDQDDGSTVAGVALLTLACPAINQPWTITIAPIALNAGRTTQDVIFRFGPGHVALGWATTVEEPMSPPRPWTEEFTQLVGQARQYIAQRQQPKAAALQRHAEAAFGVVEPRPGPGEPR